MDHIQTNIKCIQMVTDKLVIRGIQMDDIQTSNWWHTCGSHTNQ